MLLYTLEIEAYFMLMYKDSRLTEEDDDEEYDDPKNREIACELGV